MASKKKTAAVEGTEQTAVVLSYYRLQLEDIAHQKQLLAPERLSHVAAIYPQYLVQEIDDIGTNHTDLIDDDELYLADNLYLLRIILQGVADVADGIHAVVG